MTAAWLSFLCMQSTAGGYVFVGIGEYIAIGSQYEAWTSIGHENGVVSCQSSRGLDCISMEQVCEPGFAASLLELAQHC